MSAPNFRISRTTSNVMNSVLNLSIPVPNVNFFNYCILNVSSSEASTLLVVISDNTSTSYRGQASSEVLDLEINLVDFGITDFPEDKLQILIYNQQPAHFSPSTDISKFITLVENLGFSAWEDLCDDKINIINVQPDEGCGGVLEVA